MANLDPDVKSIPRRIADWIDSHPRSGWYVGFWALLVTSNALVGWLDRLLSLF